MVDGEDAIERRDGQGLDAAAATLAHDVLWLAAETRRCRPENVAPQLWAWLDRVSRGCPLQPAVVRIRCVPNELTGELGQLRLRNDEDRDNDALAACDSRHRGVCKSPPVSQLLVPAAVLEKELAESDWTRRHGTAERQVGRVQRVRVRLAVGSSSASRLRRIVVDPDLSRLQLGRAGRHRSAQRRKARRGAARRVDCGANVRVKVRPMSDLALAVGLDRRSDRRGWGALVR